MNVRHLLLLLGLAACAPQPLTATTHTTAASTPAGASALRLDVSRVADEQALDHATRVPNLRATLQYGFLNTVARRAARPAEEAVLALDDVTPRTEIVHGIRVVTVSYRARWIARDQRVIAALNGTVHAPAVAANRRELSDAFNAMYEQLIGGLDGALRAQRPG